MLSNRKCSNYLILLKGLVNFFSWQLNAKTSLTFQLTKFYLMELIALTKNNSLSKLTFAHHCWIDGSA